MAQRLVERFNVGDRVEIRFQDGVGESRWQPARVVATQAPGLWVETETGTRWYVTNGRRIRPAAGGQEK